VKKAIRSTLQFAQPVFVFNKREGFRTSQPISKVKRLLTHLEGLTLTHPGNLSPRYTQKMLLAAIDENHKGTYDFFYLPIDFKVGIPPGHFSHVSGSNLGLP
jgi:hypothetical protein